MNRKYLTESARITDAYNTVINESSSHKVECVHPNQVKRINSVKHLHRGRFGVGLRPYMSMCNHGKITSSINFKDRPSYKGYFSKIDDFRNVRTLKETRNKRVDDDFLSQDVENPSKSLYDTEYCDECDLLLNDVLDVLDQIYDELSEDSASLVDELTDKIVSHLPDNDEDDEDRLLNEGLTTKTAKKIATKTGERATEREIARTAKQKAEKALDKEASSATEKTVNKEASAGKGNKYEKEVNAYDTAQAAARDAKGFNEKIAAQKRLDKASEQIQKIKGRLSQSERKIFDEVYPQVKHLKGKPGMPQKVWAWAKQHPKYSMYTAVIAAIISALTITASVNALSSEDDKESTSDGSDVTVDAEQTDSVGIQGTTGRDRRGMNIPTYTHTNHRYSHSNHGYNTCNRRHRGEGGVVGNLLDGGSDIVRGIGGLLTTPFEFVGGGLDEVGDHLIGRKRCNGSHDYDDDYDDGYYPFNDYGPDADVKSPHDKLGRAISTPDDTREDKDINVISTPDNVSNNKTNNVSHYLPTRMN